MNKSLLITIFVIMIGFCVPAFAALDIPIEPVEMPTLPAPEPDPSWTELPERAPVITPEETSIAAVSQETVAVVSEEMIADEISEVVVAASNFVSTSTSEPSYVKSQEDMEIMTPNLNFSNSPFYQSQSSAVPEPGSIAGLSAGLLGLVFQMRRSRKHS